MTEQTNIVVWMMASLQLQDLWLYHKTIYPKHVHLIGTPQFNRFKRFKLNDTCWEEKTDESLVILMGNIIQNCFSQMLFHVVISLSGVYSWVISLHHDLLSAECLVITSGCSQNYPAHLLSMGDHLELSQIALTGYLTFIFFNFC